MKKTVSLFLTAIMILCCLPLCGCSSNGYTSSYNAVGFAHSNTDAAASMSFSEFQGTKVFQIHFKDGISKSLKYSLRLEVGNAKIYYDTDGEKKELASITSGKSVNSSLENLNCSSMYIIVETSEKCLNGNFSFEAYVI